MPASPLLDRITAVDDDVLHDERRREPLDTGKRCQNVVLETPVLISSGAWLTVFVVSPALFGPLPLWHLLSGYPYGASIIFDAVIQPALAYFGSLLALLAFAILLAVHRTRVAATIVLASVPFAALSAVHDWSRRDPIYLVILGVAYATVLAVTIIRITRRIHAPDRNRIVADTIGAGLNTAYRWSQTSGATWKDYPDLR